MRRADHRTDTLPGPANGTYSDPYGSKGWAGEGYRTFAGIPLARDNCDRQGAGPHRLAGTPASGGGMGVWVTAIAGG